MKFGSQLSADLREKHHRRAVRPRVGDTVRIVRGEFKDIEGKVTRVDPRSGVVNVEGVNREKLKGGNAPVPVRSSNLVVTSLALDDKLRKGKLEAPA
ncbi:MAG: 50S ribosomal protein L24 [Nitrososphaerota archaeon]|jgi:large subunit ribosomal protein L24|nr:50S ribosomal protein L24 [Nitrososphaerota archaeon]MDG6963964.1 50S ribosomal protein L24 [Nitrososphaerota archaeon]MDG6974562.1 50S ribosomal protein L24 [Nitrososphaerota archaeon]